MRTNISRGKINLQVYSSKKGTNDAVITTCLHTLNARGGRFEMYVKCQLLVMIIVYVHKNPSLNPPTLPSLCYIMVTSQPLFGMERGVSLSLYHPLPSIKNSKQKVCRSHVSRPISIKQSSGVMSRLKPRRHGLSPYSLTCIQMVLVLRALYSVINWPITKYH